MDYVVRQWSNPTASYNVRIVFLIAHLVGNYLWMLLDCGMAPWSCVVTNTLIYSSALWFLLPLRRQNSPQREEIKKTTGQTTLLIRKITSTSQGHVSNKVLFFCSRLLGTELGVMGTYGCDLTAGGRTRTWQRFIMLGHEAAYSVLAVKTQHKH